MKDKLKLSYIIQMVKDKQKLIIYMGLKFMLTALGLVPNMIIARRLSTDEFGLYSVAISVLAFLNAFGYTWNISVITYFGGKEMAAKNKLTNTIKSWGIIVTSSLSFITLLVFVFYGWINNYIGQAFAIYILIWMFTKMTTEALTQYYIAVKRQITTGVFLIISKIVYIAMIIFIDFDVEKLIIFNIVSQLVVLLFAFGIKKEYFVKLEPFDKKYFKQILNFSLWQLFGVAGLYLTNFGNTAVIKYYLTLTDVGIYNVADKIYAIMIGFSFAISSYYAALVSGYFQNNDTLRIRGYYYKDRFFVVAAAILIHLFIIVFAKPIVIILFSSKYLASVNIVRVMCVASLVEFFNIFYYAFYNATHRNRYLQVINVTRAAISIGLSVVLVQIFGVIGPAIATATSMIIMSFVSYMYCEKRIKRIINS